MDVNFSQTNQVSQSGSSQPTIGEKARLELTQDSGTKSAEKPEKVQAELAKVNTVEADKEVAKDEVESAVSEINQFVQAQNRQLNFSFDENSKRLVVKVTDSESGDVIRQIPSEDVLKLSERLKELQTDLGAAVGVLFNKEV